LARSDWANLPHSPPANDSPSVRFYTIAGKKSPGCGSGPGANSLSSGYVGLTGATRSGSSTNAEPFEIGERGHDDLLIEIEVIEFHLNCS
jgi:hypothetical protein